MPRTMLKPSEVECHVLAKVLFYGVQWLVYTTNEQSEEYVGSLFSI
jgi:lysophospholipid acyltransferase (LPLAT)-like uncharacterized protein